MEKQVGVYHLNQPSDSEPSYFISLPVARSLKKENKAFFINHGNAVRLLAGVIRSAEEIEILTKSKWAARPSGLPSIGYVNVLQLI